MLQVAFHDDIMKTQYHSTFSFYLDSIFSNEAVCSLVYGLYAIGLLYSHFVFIILHPPYH